MNKKASFDNYVSNDELQKLLGALLAEHHQLNNEVDILNTRIYSLFPDESTHLRHIKLRKLKLKDRIETLRTKLQLAD